MNIMKDEKSKLPVCPRCGEIDPPQFIGDANVNKVIGCCFCPDAHCFVGVTCEDCKMDMRDVKIPMFCKARQH